MECEVCIGWIHLEHVSEFKYLECILDESDTDEAECSRKVVSGRRVAGAIRSLVNARGFRLECARVLHESLLVPVLIYGRRREDLGLGLYRWTTSEDCWVSGNG